MIVYTMTTLRLTPSQKRTLEKARQVLSSRSGRRISQGEAVEQFARFAFERRADLGRGADSELPPWKDDPLFDPDIGFRLGRTDERSVDRLVYGRR